MKTIDISDREKMTITGDLSELHIPLGEGGSYVDIVIGEDESYFALCHNGTTDKSVLENQGIAYDCGSSTQWTEIDYTGVDIEFWAKGRIAVFTLHYRRSRDTSSDAGIYESMRPYTAPVFVDTDNAVRLSLEQAVALDRTETDTDVRGPRGIR